MEQIVTRDVAELAKTKGFDVPVLQHYWYSSKYDNWNLCYHDLEVHELYYIDIEDLIERAAAKL